MLRHGGDERGDAALHVAGAAAVEDAVAHFAGERVGLPVGGADRHHVGVAGEAEMRRAGADAGEQVVDLAVAQRRDGEAELAQRVGQHGLRAGIGRGYRGAADQRLGEREAGLGGLSWLRTAPSPNPLRARGGGSTGLRLSPSPCGRGLGGRGRILNRAAVR